MSSPSHQTEAINRPDELPGQPVTAVSGGNDKPISDDQHNTLEAQDPNSEDAGFLHTTSGVSMGAESYDISLADTNATDSGKAGGQKQAVEKAVELDDSTSQDTSVSLQDMMESSTATLRPDNVPSATSSNATNHLLEGQIYLDPTPKTSSVSQPPSRSTSSAASVPQSSRAGEGSRSPTRSDAGFDEKTSLSEDERETSSRSEIQSIMDQFSEEGQGPGVEEVMSPRLEFAGPLLGSPVQHPPRKSSLEPLNASFGNAIQSMQDLRIASTPTQNVHPKDPTDIGPAVPPKPGSIRSLGNPRMSDDRYQPVDTPLSPPLHRPPPPEPEPEPDLPFDFHRFLEQLRHRTADPVAKFLRSFLQEFGKKQWMVHEQVKIISDFLAFITNKMAQCEVWREVSDAEFDNAREGMEKLVMNRLYTQTFSPAIPPPQPIPGPKSRRRGVERPMGPGRRGQHQEDVERDEILAQKVSIYGWIKEEHLDIPAVGDSGRRFLVLAQQGLSQMVYWKCYTNRSEEILKIKTYRAPRDKIICVLNCCKVIFGETSSAVGFTLANVLKACLNIPNQTLQQILSCLCSFMLCFKQILST
jgi:hypothetical protein